ncbi:hypothetical protein AGR8A_Lc10399 [Agrobacterium fabrum str. J-07]|nr:hypothetical protein AGR8A_Lc10399 [Agrobacterium fabrum str. J-07]
MLVTGIQPARVCAAGKDSSEAQDLGWLDPCDKHREGGETWERPLQFRENRSTKALIYSNNFGRRDHGRSWRGPYWHGLHGQMPRAGVEQRHECLRRCGAPTAGDARGGQPGAGGEEGRRIRFRPLDR